MYQVISENISQLLFKKIIVFIALLVSATAIVYLHHSIASYSSFNTGEELNKTNIIFTFLN